MPMSLLPGRCANGAWMRERRCSDATPERTVMRNCGIRSCSAFSTGAVCAT